VIAVFAAATVLSTQAVVGQEQSRCGMIQPASAPARSFRPGQLPRRPQPQL